MRSKTSTQFVGLTRGVDNSLADFSVASNHSDDATIKLFDFTDSIFSNFKDQLRNTTYTDTTAITDSQTTLNVRFNCRFSCNRHFINWQ